MDNKFTQIVEILCKSSCKTRCKSCVNLSVKLKNFIQPVEISTFPPTFPNLPTAFPTTISPLSLPKLFHFFTPPTITTIK